MPGVIEVDAHEVAATLAELARGAGPAGAVIRDPGSARLALSAGRRALYGRIGRDDAVLVTPPDAAERVRIVPMPASFVPKAVLRAVGLVGAGPDALTPLRWVLTVHTSTVAVDMSPSSLHLDRGDGSAAARPSDVYRAVVETLTAAIPR